jgi:hypothetical protein
MEVIMATVKNVHLKVGRGDDGREFAEVSYDVHFSPTEVELNIPFHERVMLYEIDDSLDDYVDAFGADDMAVPPRRPAPALITAGDRDDVTGEVFIGEDSVRPDGKTFVSRVHLKRWRFPSNESGDEEYKALVMVTPSICRSTSWSDTVSINLR